MFQRLASALTTGLLINTHAVGQPNADRDRRNGSTARAWRQLGGGRSIGVPDLESPAERPSTSRGAAGRTGFAIGMTSIFSQQDDFRKPGRHDAPSPTALSPIPHLLVHGLG